MEIGMKTLWLREKRVGIANLNGSMEVLPLDSENQEAVGRQFSPGLLSYTSQKEQLTAFVLGFFFLFFFFLSRIFVYSLGREKGCVSFRGRRQMSILARLLMCPCGENEVRRVWQRPLYKTSSVLTHPKLTVLPAGPEVIQCFVSGPGAFCLLPASIKPWQAKCQLGSRVKSQAFYALHSILTYTKDQELKISHLVSTALGPVPANN